MTFDLGCGKLLLKSCIMQILIKFFFFKMLMFQQIPEHGFDWIFSSDFDCSRCFTHFCNSCEHNLLLTLSLSHFCTMNFFIGITTMCILHLGQLCVKMITFEKLCDKCKGCDNITFKKMKNVMFDLPFTCCSIKTADMRDGEREPAKQVLPPWKNAKSHFAKCTAPRTKRLS